MHPLIAGELPCELAIVTEEPRDGNSLLHVSCYVMGHLIFIFPKDLLLSSYILLGIFQQWNNKAYVINFKKIPEFADIIYRNFCQREIFHYEFILKVKLWMNGCKMTSLRRLRDAIRTKGSEKNGEPASWSASSPLCWFNNKEFCVLHVQSNTTIFYLLVQ